MPGCLALKCVRVLFVRLRARVGGFTLVLKGIKKISVYHHVPVSRVCRLEENATTVK